MTRWFTKFATRVAQLTGHYVAFLIAMSVIVLWAISGPLFGFSDTWQLVINTGTTIITFLMVFLIQHTQNRDAMAMQLKLDEIIRAIENADNAIIEAEEESDETLRELKEKYQNLDKQHLELQERLSTVESPNGADTVAAKSE
ncbi:MAG: low affinity iron permease family protein [Thermomicrobiales bacterium]